jgi:hypothetical protein
MIRSLRAFVWLRWRLVVNGIRSGRRRDTLEQVSRTLQTLSPILLGALSVGSIVGATVMGFLAGRAVAHGAMLSIVGFFVFRALLGILLLMSVVITALAPTQTQMTSYTRLLLLPIARSTLHLLEVAANLADPWVAVLVPLLLTFALGLAVGGRPDVGVVAAVAAPAMVLVFVSLAALVSFAVRWLLRSRRRGELFTLLFVLGVSLLSILPAIMSSRMDGEKRATSPTSTAPTKPAGGRRTRSMPSEPFSVAKFDAALPRWTRAIPSELYGVSLNSAMAGRQGTAWLAVVVLIAEGVLLFAASSAVHARLIGSLENEQDHRRRISKPLGGFEVPFVRPSVAAVAMTYLRMALRSVRGRLAILLPAPMLLAIATLVRRMPDVPDGMSAVFHRGDLLFAVGSVLALHALQPFTMNLFGTDRAGLTLLFLSPLDDRDLARGKILGCALLLGVSMSLCLLGAVIVAPGGEVWTWLAVPIGIAAVWMWASPLAVWLSILFPVAADLSKTGKGGNPHPLAMLVGLVAVMGLLVPTALLFVAAEFWLRKPPLVLVFELSWLLVAVLVAWPLLNFAASSLSSRRENLALLR